MQSTGMESHKVFLANNIATHNLGQKLAIECLNSLACTTNVWEQLRPILLLHGNLGTGKTSLVHGIAKGLGIRELITSPTFALAHHYFGKIDNKKTALIHLDLYRLHSESSADELFLEEEENAKDIGAIMAVEWPERLSFIPTNSWTICLHFFDINHPEYGREIEIKR